MIMSFMDKIISALIVTKGGSQNKCNRMKPGNEKNRF